MVGWLLGLGWRRRLAYPVAGMYWRGSSQILHDDGGVGDWYCTPQVEQIARSRGELDIVIDGLVVVLLLLLMLN